MNKENFIVAPEDYMAMWEAFLEMRKRYKSLDETWDNIGTAEMRTEAALLATAMEEAFYSLTDDEKDEVRAEPWDWHHVPRIVELYCVAECVVPPAKFIKPILLGDSIILEVTP